MGNNHTQRGGCTIMIQMTGLGKVVLTRFVLGGCVLVWGCLVCVGPPIAAAATGPGEGEQAWLLLARGETAAAQGRAEPATDLRGVWIATVARLRQDAGRPPAPDRTSELAATAAAAWEAGDFAVALDAVDALLALPDPDLAPVDRLFLQARRGACLVGTGRIAAADSALTVVLADTLTARLPVLRCYALLARGRGRVRTRQVEPPRQDLLAARELALELEIPGWAGTAAIALSVVSRLQMDLDDALRWRVTALADYRAAGDLGGQARALHYIATIRIMQGDLTRAMTMLQDALGLARRAGSDGEIGGIQGDMAGINYLLGNFDQALVEYAEAVRLAPNPRQRGMMLLNVGSIQEYRAHFDEAVAALGQARELLAAAGDYRSEALALAALGKTGCADSSRTACLEYLDQALVLSRQYQVPMTEAYALAVKGHVLLERGDVPAAAAVLDSATAVARRIDYFDVLGWSLLGQARVARRQGRPEEALAHLREALTEVDDLERRSTGAAAVTGGIVSQAGALFDETIDLLHEQYLRTGDRRLAAEAFAVAQKAKDRAFLNLLAEAEYDLRYSAVPGYREQEAEILTRLATLEQLLDAARRDAAPADTLTALQARLAGAEDELRLLEAGLRAAEPGYAEVLYPEPLTPEDLGRQVLAPDEAFLEYALGDSASYLWLIRGPDVAFARLPARREIVAAVRQVLPLLTDYNLTGPAPAWFVPAAHELYRLLLEPVADRLDGVAHLIVSPDEILHYLPFEALPTSEAPAATYAEVPFLVAQQTISYTPAAGVLAQLRRGGERNAVTSADRWLLVGDPVLQAAEQAGVLARAAGATDLPALAHAGRELDRLAALAPDGDADILRAETATWFRLEAASEQTYSLVHFATHGLYNEARPRYSGLVISPDPAAGQDGFLSVSEVLGLRLPCRQVALSACATALGETITGEGVASLNRSFLFTGARSVVAALWNVSDEATAELMAAYYARLAREPDRRAAALDEVKRAFVAGRIAAPRGDVDWAHPTFWAGFVLSGDGR